VAREFLEQFPDSAAPSQTAAVPPPSSISPASSVATGDHVLRLTLSEAGAPFIRGCVLADMRRRWAAVACDAGVVIAIAAIVFVACDKFWLPLAVSTLGY